MNPLTLEVRRALQEQGQQFQGSDDDLTLALAALNRPELFDHPEFRADYDAIREANSPGAIGGIVNTARSAFDRSVQAKNVIGAPDETDVEDIAQRERAIRARPSSTAWSDWQTSQGSDAIKTFLRDPVEITSNIVAAGLAGSLPAIAGGLAGGALGTAVGGPVGGTAGAITGTGAGSLAVEYGNKYLDVLRDAGADLADPQSILRVVNDPEIRARAQELGLRRGLPVAAFDAASAGLAGKFVKGLKGTPATSRTIIGPGGASITVSEAARSPSYIRAGLAEAALQGTLGGAGEVAGALSAGEQISPGAVFEEVVGELGPGAAEVAGSAMRRSLARETIAPPSRTAPTTTAFVPPVNAPAATQPVAPTLPQTPTVSLARRVALMTPEEQQARAADLVARTDLIPAEQQELDLLRAFVGEAAPPTPPLSPADPIPGGDVSGTATAGEIIPAAVTPTPVVEPVTGPAGATAVAAAVPAELVDIGTRDPNVSTGTGIATPAEAQMIADWKQQIAAESPTAPPLAQVTEPTVAPVSTEAAVAGIPTLAEPPPESNLSDEEKLALWKKAKTKPKGRAFQFSTLPDGAPDLLNAIFDLGGVAPPGENAGGEYDQFGEHFGGSAGILVRKGASKIDDLADQLGFADVPSFNAALESAKRNRARAFANLEAQQKDERAAGQTLAFQRAAFDNEGRPKSQVGTPIVSDELYTGDRFKVKREPIEVVGVDENTGDVIVNDGPRFGVQRIPAGQTVYPDRRTLRRIPRGEATFLTEEDAAQVSPAPSDALSLESATVEQQAAEAAAARVRAQQVAQQNAIATKAEAPLVGDSSNVGQGALFNEGTDLFSGPSAESMELMSATPGVPTTPIATEAKQASDLATAISRLTHAGMQVDAFTRTLFEARLADEMNRRLDALIARYQVASEERQPAIQQQIERMQAQIAALENGTVAGVALTPNHISIALDDVTNGAFNGLVALLHEGGHALLGRNPAMRARVVRAVNGAMIKLRLEHSISQERTGLRESSLSDPEELIVSKLAQELAIEGIPDSPSLARAIWSWVKDLYYRTLMAVQAAAEQLTGRRPDPQVALDWMENEMRRLVGGDYDYRFANLFQRLQPEPLAQNARRMEGIGTTPGNITDFYDRRANAVRQPQMLADSTEAIDWNAKFMTTEEGAANPGDEQDIPYAEATDRWHAAATNELSKFADAQYETLVPQVEGQPRMSFDEFWTLVSGKETPHQLLAAYEQRSPNSSKAEIGGERMTHPMNELARVEAKRLIYQWQKLALEKTARATEAVNSAEGRLTTAAERVRKLGTDLRNAATHEAQFREALKADIAELVTQVRNGFNLSRDAGALAEAIRHIEGLTEEDEIPSNYREVFRQVFRDDVSLFDYLEAVAKMDSPLFEMTAREVVRAIEANAEGDPVLARLMEPKNKPLLAAVVTLARKNAEQVDLLNVRLIKDGAKYLALKADIDAIRSATVDELRAMDRRFGEGKKAVTFADRIKQRLVNARQRLLRAQAAIQDGETRQEMLAKIQTALAEKVDEMETNGLPAPSEWTPGDGATYYAMYQAEDGSWRKRDRTLGFTPEGPAVDADRVAADLVANRQYLTTNEKKRGSKLYESVARMTQELERLDVFQSYPELQRWFATQMFLPSADALLAGGGAGAARASQMLKRFQSIILQNWHQDVQIPALKFVEQWKRTARAAGFDDLKLFWKQVVEPAVYAIQVNPGLDEGPALREALRAGKRRIEGDVAPAFDEEFKTLLRLTKERSEFFKNLFEKEGIFIEDKSLGELRNAVPRGWMTLIRRISSPTVGTITRAMDKAGWRVAFVDPETERPVSEGFEQGVARGRKIVGATSFDSLLPDPSGDEQQEAAKAAVLEDPESFAQAISGFFTPTIIERWLAPFINKPGEGVFRNDGNTIDQLTVQQAWQDAGGDVAKWIDALGQAVGLETEITEDDGNAMELGDLSLEARWRADMLRKLDRLFLRTSKIAADASQVKDIWDQAGQPSHLLMDARDEDWLPPEFLESMTFDPINSRNLLSTLAFHAAFGRNGDAMVKAMGETESNLKARKVAFQDITGKTRAERERQAQESGYTYKELKEGAKLYDQQMRAQELLKAQFGFGLPAGVFGDVRGGLELLHFIASQTTNNFKTGLLNLLQPAQRALARRSLGPAVIRDTSGAYWTIGKTFFGGVLEKFGLHLLRASEHAKEVGAMQGAGLGAISNAELMGLATGKRGEELPTAIKTGRIISASQQRGYGAKPREFPRAQVIPFFENTMAGLGLTAAVGNGNQEAVAIERIVKAAMDYFAANPEDAANPSFRLTARDLGMDNLGWFGDRGTFDYFRRKLPDYGLGSLETLTRGAMERAKLGQPILTKEHVAAAANLAGTELDLQGSINSNPASWASNSFLKFATPLLGWPIRQMNSVHQAFREQDGRGSALAALRAISILAAWSLPIGLAFTFLTDEWDDKVMKKKTNLGRLSGLAGVPGVGPALALATSDIPAFEQFKSMMQRSSRANNIYGLGQDAITSMLTGLDPTSGQRQFSLDSRILAFSQLRTLFDAMGSFINTGGAVTWSSVERPIIASMGGNGALSAIDIFNNALGLDNAESRMVQRTNATSWIREAGRAVGLEIKKSGGASVTPTPVTVWVREMSFAAYANDRLSFLENYRKAIDTARLQGDPEPEKTVLENWRSRNPLGVLSHKPTDLQVARMLSVMDDNGREAVQSALRLYNHYTDLIKPSPAQQQERRMMSQINRMGQAPNYESLRRSLANEALSVR